MLEEWSLWTALFFVFKYEKPYCMYIHIHDESRIKSEYRKREVKNYE